MMKSSLMSTLDVLKNPNHGLREKSEPLTKQEVVSDETKKLITDLIETMKVEDGVGIAAPQVGVHKRVIIVDNGEGVKAFINPKIISRSIRKTDSEEGCLSVPGIFGIVKRNKKVKVKAIDENGEPVRVSASGLTATVFQHEIDHLDGILFIDKVERYTTPPKL